MPTMLRNASTLLAAALLFGVTLAPPASAQEHKAGAWAAFAGQGHFDYPSPDARWRWWFDAHARFLESSGFDTSIVRPGVGYDVGANSTLWLGYAWIHSDPTAGQSSDENRIWQQYTWGKPINLGNVYSRTRLEQRFDSRGADMGWRLRQFVRWTQPLAEGTQLGLRVWDEAFVDLNDTDWGAASGFRQNRLFAGFGWTFASDENLTLEFGYLNQFLDRVGTEDGMNHTLSIQLLLTR